MPQAGSAERVKGGREEGARGAGGGEGETGEESEEDEEGEEGGARVKKMGRAADDEREHTTRVLQTFDGDPESDGAVVLHPKDFERGVRIVGESMVLPVHAHVQMLAVYDRFKHDAIP